MTVGLHQPFSRASLLNVMVERLAGCCPLAKRGLVAGLDCVWIAARLLCGSATWAAAGGSLELADALGRSWPASQAQHMIDESPWSGEWSGLAPWRSTDFRICASDLWSEIKGPRLNRG